MAKKKAVSRTRKLKSVKSPKPTLKKPGFTEVRIYLQDKVHRFMKAAAAQRGMPLGDYLVNRAISDGPITVSGPFEAAPTEAQNEAAKLALAATSESVQSPSESASTTGS